MTSLKQNKVFRLTCVAVSALLVLGSFGIAPPDGLSQEGWTMLAIVIGAMVLFISEAVPLAATCFLIIIAMKYTGVVSWKVIQQTACSSTVFFCMAGFGLGAALQNTNLAAILLRTLYRIGKGDSRKMISAVCWLAAIVSIFVSDGAAQIVVLAVVSGVVKAFGDPEPGTSRLAGGLMMAITVGAFTGGLFLPCSNSVNIAIMDLSEVVAGIPMTFFQWALFGVPCGLLLTIFSAWLLPRYFKPEELTVEQKAEVEKLFAEIPDHFNAKDKWYMAISVVMIVLWFASNWISLFETATVAMAGMFLMMLPGIDLLTAKEYKKNFSPMVIVTMLCIFPLASAVGSTGIGEWAVNKMFANAANWNLIIIFIMATFAAFMVHCLVPQGSANGALSATVIAPILVGAGIPVSAAMALIGIQAGTGFLFPIEGTWQYTFGTGHYSFSDCIKGNWPITLFGMMLCVLLIPLLSMLFSGMGLI